jgi:hypothetical protein
MPGQELIDRKAAFVAGIWILNLMILAITIGKSIGYPIFIGLKSGSNEYKGTNF